MGCMRVRQPRHRYKETPDYSLELSDADTKIRNLYEYEYVWFIYYTAVNKKRLPIHPGLEDVYEQKIKSK